MNKTNLIICLVLFFLLFFITGCDVIPHDVPPVRLNPPWITRHNITSSQYQDAFDTYTEDGYRLTYVNCHNYNGSVRYNAIWEKIGGPSWYAFHGQTADEYQVKVDELKELGFHPVLVNPCNVNGQVYFASIFEQRNVAWIARHGLTHAEYQTEFDEHGENGYFLQFVAGYQEGNQARYAAIWEKTTGPPLLIHSPT